MHVERLVRNYRKVKRIEALQQENVRHAQRELYWYSDDDGYWVVRSRLTAEQGALVQKVLEQVLDEDFREHQDVPAGISSHCSNTTHVPAFTLPPKPFRASGWERKWTMIWPFW